MKIKSQLRRPHAPPASGGGEEGGGRAAHLLADERGLEVVVVLQVEGPQEADRFPRGDVGHKPPLIAHLDGRAAAADGQVPHQLHHLHLQVAPLPADLRPAQDVVVRRQPTDYCVSHVWWTGLELLRSPM